MLWALAQRIADEYPSVMRRAGHPSADALLREVMRTKIRGKPDTARRESVISQNYSFVRVADHR